MCFTIYLFIHQYKIEYNQAKLINLCTKNYHQYLTADEPFLFNVMKIGRMTDRSGGLYEIVVEGSVGT